MATTLGSSLTKKSFTCKVPSNIALVKYWGKEKNQIPKNTSISFTLSACFTLTTLVIKRRNKGVLTGNDTVNINFEGKKNETFKPKIITFLERIELFCPYLKEYKLEINTRNSFPHSSGIASSASGFAAIAHCIMQLEKELNPIITKEYFIKKASFLARLGSGSASRSLEGEVVIWGKHLKVEGSSNLFGIKFPYKLHANFKNYHDTILLVDKGKKQVSSTVGHHLMQNHPFAKQRFTQANDNITKIKNILQNGDLKEFINIVESEALTLHAMMMASKPYFILMKPNTLKIIQSIWRFREETKLPICFTLDAGANVHILYPEKYKIQINEFITNKLVSYCQNNSYICDRIGFGVV
ncbi:MAG: diphosphomevalonate decarboxylase [Flavobacteriaceae bacterium]|nr:diphosphomevalonate decarboxylase [Flavobacteriaceae bacterium]